MDTYIREFTENKVKPTVIEKIGEFDTITKGKQLFGVFHTNIRSLSKNFDSLKIFLARITVSFDVIVLTETYQLLDIDVFNMDGYDIIYNNGNINKNDGVIVLIKNNLEYTYQIVEIGPINALQLNINVNKIKYEVLCIYRPPSTCIETFNRNLCDCLSSEKCNVIRILTGDINIDILNDWEATEEYKNILSCFGYTAYINECTRPLTGTCLDHLYIQNVREGINVESCIFHYNITDHYPIALMMDQEKNVTKNTKVKLEKKYVNYKNLRNDLINEKWENLYNTFNIESATIAFINKLKDYIMKNTNTVSKNWKNKPRKSWINQKIIEEINVKNDLYKQTQQFPNNPEIAAKYKKQKYETQKMITISKKKYAEKLIEKNRNKTKGLWDTVNNIRNKTKPQSSITRIITESGINLNKQQDICNAFNRYFSSIGKKLSQNITVPKNYKEEKKSILESTMYLFNTTDYEVEDVIKQLKSNKKPGYDEIYSETLKEIKSEISKPLAFLINLSFNNGYFPEVLKTGVVIPIYKSGDKYDISNYRPISLISNVSKIYEKIIKSRIVKFLDKHRIISERQFGFRRGRSTEDAIQYVSSCIYNAVDKKIPVLGIFVDLSKAFDTVSHEILLEKLENCGLRGNVSKLIKSYLSGRMQVVKIGEYKSNYERISVGVPQGTVLGPLLFTLYINNLLLIDSPGQIISFADDTTILYSANTWAELKTIAERDFLEIKKWFQYNKLTLNVKKTKYISFTSYANNLPHMGSLIIDKETTIPEEQCISYLGVMFDSHLRWNNHITTLVNKLRRLVGTFKYLREYLDERHLITIYYALFQSQICYGIIGWGGVADKYLKKLTVLQRWILKIILKKPLLYPSDRLFSDSNVLDVRKLHFLKSVILIQRGGLKKTELSHQYDTRKKSENLLTLRCKKVIGQKGSEYLAPKYYSKLPVEIKTLKNLKQFKFLTKKWLMDLDSYQIGIVTF